MNQVTALLGPTNTGKTYRAVQRMLKHRSGMMGLPLRLLAREIYDRISAQIGESKVALVTGEEKRVPASPQFWICTVEAMPVSRKVDFVAIDEVQLAAQHQRGHVFTERILHARGRQETWLLGASTIAPLLKKMIPDLEIETHPRLSKLTYAGSYALSSLPKRSAVIAFSTPQVYEVAQWLRERHGGTAVVLGALSPRTRNAQVAMYQAGEVDYIVATDAIGMGLNMDVQQVCFASLRKFDGHEYRMLESAELAQIAGRAGRYTQPGYFGTLKNTAELSPKIIRDIEEHRFTPVNKLYWRNHELDFHSLESLIASLRHAPKQNFLLRSQHAHDVDALLMLATQPEIRRLCTNEAAIHLLWQVCRIPDYRQLWLHHHPRLLAKIYEQLRGAQGRLDIDWLARKVTAIDNTEGSVDTLVDRIASIRIWTYVANHSSWVDQPLVWQERTRAIEDRLSDALHHQLMQRFVKRATSVSLAESTKISQWSSHRFRATHANPFAQLLYVQASEGQEGNASEQDILEAWVQKVVESKHEDLLIDATGTVFFENEKIAELQRGPTMLQPEVRVLSKRSLGAGASMRLHRRVQAWSRDLVAQLLAPLHSSKTAKLSPAGRGLLYQLEQKLGAIASKHAKPQLRSLTRLDRRIFRNMNIELGTRAVFCQAMISAQYRTERIALWKTYVQPEGEFPIPPVDALSFRCPSSFVHEYALLLGYLACGPRAIRLDYIEALCRQMQETTIDQAFYCQKFGCLPRELPAILRHLGFVRNRAKSIRKKKKQKKNGV